MRRLLDRTQIVESREVNGKVYEVCAAAVATLNESNNALSVSLDCFVRSVNPRGADRQIRPDWLPHPDHLMETVSLGEAFEELGEIFQNWVSKVRASIPNAAQFEASVSLAESMPCSASGQPV